MAASAFAALRQPPAVGASLGAAAAASFPPESVPPSVVVPPWQFGSAEPSLIFTAEAANVAESQKLSLQPPAVPVVEQ